jgi:vitamin B12/bleomycin/antimicrobial peptide transport system ATP-binding/permease protein
MSDESERASVSKARGLDPIGQESEVRDLLDRFRLGSLLNRYSLDGTAHNWSQLLSIGEQQRLMMVTALLVGTETIRLFILDETTSGCDRKTEQTMYDFLQQSNIQYVSVSHRPEIESYHSRKMIIDPKARTYTITSNKNPQL